MSLQLITDEYMSMGELPQSKNHPKGLEETTFGAHTGQRMVCDPICRSAKFLVSHGTSRKYIAGYCLSIVQN